jgi:hypothetical protein
MRYFNIVSKNEALEGIHSIDPPGVLPLPAPNVYFNPLPAGMMWTYDGAGLPNGVTPIPAPSYTAEEQARIDLRAAGVSVQSVLAARYMNDRGDPTLLAAIDAAIDLVVISSGLTLLAVSGLV